MNRKSLSVNTITAGILTSMVLALAPDTQANNNVYITRFWHNHQPIYWPEWNGNGSQTERMQYAFDSIQLKKAGAQAYGTGQQHPSNKLADEGGEAPGDPVFTLNDRIAAYQDGPRASLQEVANRSSTAGGYAMSYSGSLMANVRNLGQNNAYGYGPGWWDGIRTASGWTTPSGSPRLDIVGFTYHHAIAPLLPKPVLKKEIQIFRDVWWKVLNKPSDVHSKGFFPTEMAFSKSIIDVLAEEGLEWSIVASHHLSRTCPTYLNRTQTTLPGSWNIKSSPPNKADLLGPSPNTGWWFDEPNPGQAALNVAPFAYQLHKAKYVNPETGAESWTILVPSDDTLSYKAGYSGAQMSMVNDNISPHANSATRPVLVMPSTDGDNAWGGGNSSWMESTPAFFQEANNQHKITTPQDFVNAFGQYATEAHVEDGAWIFPVDDYGSPYFLKWIEPPLIEDSASPSDPRRYPYTKANMEQPGFALKFWSWAPVIAGANWVETAEQILIGEGGSVASWKIQDPYDWNGGYVNPNVVERAWHIYLGGLDSGFNYYGGLGNDDEVKQSLATRRAYDLLTPWMTTQRRQQDQTGPTILKPQRFPYNPGWYTFGWFNSFGSGTNANYLKKMPSEFYVWSHIYDLNGVQSANLKVRIDGDGVNTMANNQNETYAGGADVGSWVTIPMTMRALPKTSAELNAKANNSQINYFIEAGAVADYYFAKITDAVLPGFRGNLLDYYIESTDTRGNVRKTDIQHVWVENDGNGGPPPSNATFSNDPRDCAPLTVTYAANAGPLSNSVPVKMWYSFTGGSPFASSNMTHLGGGTSVVTLASVPDNAPSLTVYFQNSTETITDNRNGLNWSVIIRDCDAVQGPGSATTIPASPSSCDPVTIRYFPNTGVLQTANPVYIHIGRNGWQNRVDPRPAMTKVSNYWEYVYNTPTNTTQINFVFTTLATGDNGTWDNNGGADWNIAVSNCGTGTPPPQTVSINPTNPVGCGPIAITYNPAGRPLATATQVLIHVGRNGWQDVINPSPAMTKAGSVWTYTYNPAPGTTNINIAFNNGAGQWDSNGGADWHFTVAGCTNGPPPPSGFAITNPPSDITVGNAVASYNVQGIATGVVGQLRWTNTLTGGSGTIPVANPWTISALPLGVGANVITVTGTNTGSSVATNAADSAAAYGSSWTNGSNLGTGFGPWALESVGMAGHFAAATGWGLWSHEPTNYSAAVRPLPSSLAAGQTFHVRMKNGWIWESGGSVGVALRDTGGDEKWKLYFVGGSNVYIGTHATDIGWTDAGLDIAFTLLNATNYSVAITPVGGGATRTYAGAITGQINNVRAWSYGNGTSDGQNSNRDFFIDNLKVVSAGGGSGISTSDTVTITREAGGGDVNGDGIPDAWLAGYGMSPTNHANALTPGGNATFLEEYLYDTDPSNPASYHPNRIVYLAGEGTITLRVEAPTSTGRWYDVWWTTSLLNSAWTPMNFNRPGHADQSPVLFTVTNALPQLYYRTGVRIPVP